MILGAGVYQVPLIKKAKEMGLRTVVVSVPGNYPGIPLADAFLEINTVDKDAVLQAAKKYAIDGILTTGTDVCVPTIGYVVDSLGLSGPSYAAACRSMDKTLMKEAFAKNEIPTAAFGVFQEKNEAQRFAVSLGYPVMVKAPDSSGSRGVSKASCADEFEGAWERAYTVSRSKKVLVEAFLDGNEFGADAFVRSPGDVSVFIHGTTVSVYPCRAPIGHSFPSMFSTDFVKRAEEVACHAVIAMELSNCAVNFDMIAVGEEPYVIEMAGRMGATCLPENLEVFTGVDVYAYMIGLALGGKAPFLPKRQKPNASLLLRSQEDGSVDEVLVPKEVSMHPDLIELHLDVKPGDSVQKFIVGPDRVGHIITYGETAEKAERTCEMLASKISFRVRKT